MGTNNFMAADLRAIFLGSCLFSVIGFGPGYALGRLFDLMRFRARTLTCRIALGVAFSIALCPTLTYFIGRYLSLNAAFAAFAALSLYSGFSIVAELRSTRDSIKPFTKPIALAGLWIAIAVASLSDMQFGRRLYFSVIGFDYFVRTSFTAAVSNFGIPPPNPFYFPGHPVLLRYHYFWLAQAALIHHIAYPLVDARQAFVGATVWCGLGLICVLALYLRFFSSNGSRNLVRRLFIGICFLGITGLDILPTLFFLSLTKLGLVKTLVPSVEWWNNQIDGWLYTMLWEPHYVAGLIACLTGFLMIWTSCDGSSRTRAIASVAAGLAFATGVGAGLYVAMVFAVFLFCWMLVAVSRRWYREALMVMSAGIVAVILSTPFLLGLRGAASGGAFLQATVRSFFLGEVLLSALGFSRPWQLALGNALFLPLNYLLELGFFLMAARIQWQKVRATKAPFTRYQLACLSMICASAGVCTFVKSGVIENNDLGWRGFLIAQFVLLILATDLWTNRAEILNPQQYRLLGILLVLGAAGVIYDLSILRFFPLLSDAGVVANIGWLSNDQQLGPRTYANREAYEWIRANTSPREIIQQNPGTSSQDTFYGLYSNRQTVAEANNCGTVFGGDPRGCEPIIKVLRRLYSKDESSNPETFDRVCDTLAINILIAKDVDPAWAAAKSWVWQREPVFANSYVRAFTCARPAGNLVLTYRGKNRD